MTADSDEDIEEGMVVVDVEVVEETGSLDGNSSIQDPKKLVGVVAMVAEPRDSRSYNFALKVERGSIENKMNGIVYSCSTYYSNYSCYLKMEPSLEPYLDFKATKDFSVQ